MQNLRINCAKIIQKILEDKVFFGELKKQIPEKDLPFINMLVLVSLRNWSVLEKILALHLGKKIPNKHRMAKYLIIMAIAEILFMNTAQYAVINETVKSVKKSTDAFLGGLANAVLRKIASDTDGIREKICTISPIAENFREILQGYDDKQINKIAKSLTLVPPLDLSVKNNPEDWQQKLNATLLPNGSLRIFDAPKIYEISGYDEGQWWVQDVAASLPVLAMGDVKDKEVIDLCAAPGGKTAQLLAKGAKVTALDISAERLNTLKQNMARLGYSDVTTIATDALYYMQNAKQEFDAILLDAPCSATGTFRRHPEVLHIKNIDDVIEQAELQKKMLESCHKILKIGGTLLYSVCSISKLEGEKQIADFLAKSKHFKLEKIEMADISAYGSWNDDIFCDDGTIRTLPYHLAEKNGMDAFFICKMKRII